jgi:RecB family endonuclease NucS
MRESDFELIISRYPELIENGLVLKGRQVKIQGKAIDLMFEDRHGQKLIVELKRGPILRELNGL